MSTAVSDLIEQMFDARATGDIDTEKELFRQMLAAGGGGLITRSGGAIQSDDGDDDGEDTDEELTWQERCERIWSWVSTQGVNHKTREKECQGMARAFRAMGAIMDGYATEDNVQERVEKLEEILER